MMLRNLLFACLLTTTATAASAQCNELFFSEYLEGASNNKAIEIYNPTSAAINLTDYVIYRYNNGSPVPTDSLFPQDILAPGDVWVAGNPSAVPSILAVSDTLHTITFFNGDDAMSIKKISTGQLTDVIGVIGVDPGTNWIVGIGATSENTLVRNASVNQGTTNWVLGSTQYDVYPQNTDIYLGAHTMTPCVTPIYPTISFQTAATSVSESNTSVNVVVTIQPNGSTDTTTVDVTVAAGSTATAVSDYVYASTPLIWLPGDSSTRTVTVNIVDDLVVEPTETVELEFTNATNNAILGANHLISISDNDFPTYTIGDVNNVDSNGVGDSLGLKCWLHGVVYGVNLRATGIQFTIIDPTGGIGVFNGAAFPGYSTVTETDSIHILGTVNQFNGLLQIDPDSIILVNTGNALKQPTTVTTLVEANESDLIRFNAGWLVNPAQWTGTGSGFNVDVTDGTNTVVVRIDNDVTLYSAPAPVGIFNVWGLGSQFDNSSPYTEGYQLMPRYSQDIQVLINLDLGPDATGCAGDTFVFDAGPGESYLWSTGDTTRTIVANTAGTYTVTVTNNTYNVSDSDTVNVAISPAPVASFSTTQVTGTDFSFTNTSTSATGYFWTFGDGNTSTTPNPIHTYGIPGSYLVTLIATGACGSDTTDTLVTAFVGIHEPALAGVIAYPNPSNGTVMLRFEQGLANESQVLLSDALGRVVLLQSVNDMPVGSELRLELPARGLYFLQVRNTEGVHRAALTVE